MSRAAPKPASAPAAPRPAVPPPPPAQPAADVPPAQAGEESVVPATPSSAGSAADQVASPKEEVLVLAKEDAQKDPVWRIRNELADLRSDNLELRRLNTSLVVAFTDGKLKIRRNIDKKKQAPRVFKFKEIEVDEEEKMDA